MLNKEFIAKWVDALESGEFKQGKHRLKAGDSYCCLGVACELYRREGLGGEWGEDDCFMGVPSVLPHKVTKYIGLENYNPVIKNNPNYNLASYNDDGHTFKELAQIIRKQYLEEEQNG